MIYPWHQSVWQQILHARHTDHLPHALLLSGEAGCGHEVLVGALAQALLCTQPLPDGSACTVCRSCQVYAAHAHPDFMQIAVPEDKQVIGVEQIRTLGHFLELSCSYSACRVAVILMAEAMNVNAANSLLKSLEEPSAHTHILLLSMQPAALLATIRSRCQHIRLPLPAKKEAIHWLGQQNPVQAPEALLTLAAGRPLAALAYDSGESLAQQLLFAKNINDLIAKSTSISEVSPLWEKHPRAELIDWQLHWLHDLLSQHYSGKISPLSLDYALPLQQLVRYFDTAGLWRLYDALLELKPLATHPLNPRLFVENMLSLWVNMSKQYK